MICGPTGKTILDEERAYEILDRLQYSGRKRRRYHCWVERSKGGIVRIRRAQLRRRERRVYRCEHCGQWHLMSRV